MQSAVLIIATSKNFIQPKLVYPSYKPSGKVKRNGRQTVRYDSYSLINPNLYAVFCLRKSLLTLQFQSFLCFWGFNG